MVKEKIGAFMKLKIMEGELENRIFAIKPEQLKQLIETGQVVLQKSQ